jgi:hypothetical protein
LHGWRRFDLAVQQRMAADSLASRMRELLDFAVNASIEPVIIRLNVAAGMISAGGVFIEVHCPA